MVDFEFRLCYLSQSHEYIEKSSSFLRGQTFHAKWEFFACAATTANYIASNWPRGQEKNRNFVVTLTDLIAPMTDHRHRIPHILHKNVPHFRVNILHSSFCISSLLPQSRFYVAQRKNGYDCAIGQVSKIHSLVLRDREKSTRLPFYHLVINSSGERERANRIERKGESVGFKRWEKKKKPCERN